MSDNDPEDTPRNHLAFLALCGMAHSPDRALIDLLLSDDPICSSVRKKLADALTANGNNSGVRIEITKKGEVFSEIRSTYNLQRDTFIGRWVAKKVEVFGSKTKAVAAAAEHFSLSEKAIEKAVTYTVKMDAAIKGQKFPGVVDDQMALEISEHLYHARHVANEKARREGKKGIVEA